MIIQRHRKCRRIEEEIHDQVHPHKALRSCPPFRDVAVQCTGLCEKVPAKFGKESSVNADGLCIGCLRQWAEEGRENSNMQEFFCTTLYIYLITCLLGYPAY